MEGGYRRKIIVLMTFLGGVYFVFEFLTPESLLKQWGIAENHDQISLGFVAIGLVTFGLGIINLLMIHGSRILFRRKGWLNSFALLLGLFSMISFSLMNWISDLRDEKSSSDLTIISEFSRHIAESQNDEKRRATVPPFSERLGHLVRATQNASSDNTSFFEAATLPAREDSSELLYSTRSDILEKMSALNEKATQLAGAQDDGLRLTLIRELGLLASEGAFLKRQYFHTLSANSFSNHVYHFLFNALFISLGSAMFSLLGVYIAAAAYRAFRIRSLESSLMMAAALVVMLGQIPFGLWISDDMPEIRGWLLEVPNSAASRAIRVGALVASLVLAFRMWFSIESEKFSGDDS